MRANVNPAIDCGIDPRDGLLVAWLPKMDTVLEEHYRDNGRDSETAYSLDGMLIDIKSRKRLKWWYVRREAGFMGMRLPDIVWQGIASDYVHGVSVDPFAPSPEPEMKLYMRAYSQGPWICIDDEQMEKVYASEQSSEHPGAEAAAGTTVTA